MTNGNTIDSINAEAAQIDDALRHGTDPNVPHTWVSLAHYAELQETIDRLGDSLARKAETADRYKLALVRISGLCAADDTARAYIGDIARAAINPPITAKPGQEQSK